MLRTVFSFIRRIRTSCNGRSGRVAHAVAQKSQKPPGLPFRVEKVSPGGSQPSYIHHIFTDKKERPRENPPDPSHEHFNSIVVNFSFSAEAAHMAVGIIALFLHLCICRIWYRAVASLAV